MRYFYLLGFIVLIPCHFGIPANADVKNPLEVIVNPAYPTTHDNITVEGGVVSRFEYIGVELTEYKWVDEHHLIFYINLIPSGYAPYRQDQTFFAIKLKPFPAGDYTLIFIDNQSGKEIQSIPITVQQGLVSFSMNLSFSPAGDKGNFEVDLQGEFPSTGFSIQAHNLNLSGKQITASLRIDQPANFQSQVIVPFQEPLGTLSLPDGVYHVTLEANGYWRDDYFIEVKDSQIEKIEPPSAVYLPPLRNARMTIEPFEAQAGETVRVKVTGYFPSTAYSVTGEEIRKEGSIYGIHLTMNQAEIGDAVIVPFEREYLLENVRAGNYEVLLVIGQDVPAFGKFHVKGPVLEPSYSFPFHVELRLNIPYSQIKNDVNFLLTGAFPTPGYTFAEKNVKIEGDQVTVTARIQSPTEPQAQVITPFQEVIGALEIADLWERTYTVTAVVNDQPLEPVHFGGDFSPWSYINVRADHVLGELGEVRFYLEGFLPANGIEIMEISLERQGNQINAYATVQEFSLVGMGNINNVIFQSLGSLLLPDFQAQSYQLNLFLNGEKVQTRIIGGDSNTNIQDWTMF